MYSQAEHDKAIFYFDVFRDMCCDIDIQEDADCLVLGNEEEKCSYKLSDANKVFPQVKTLYIGPNVIDIVIRNAMFPNVKKVISDNPMFARKYAGETSCFIECFLSNGGCGHRPQRCIPY